jgi:hypothetical protein
VAAFVIIALLSLIALHYARRLLRALAPAWDKKLRNAMLAIGVAVLAALAASGRLGWALPLLGAAFIALVRLAPALIQFFPLLQRLLRPSAERGQEAPGASSGGSRMSREEALDILGLGSEATRADIIAAHRRLMQKMHPDRGGSDYLAGKINRARDVLLG